jgi:hypothetical protein
VIEYLNFYSNRMTGTIPESLRWRNLFLLDLGRNRFTGTLPADLGERFVELRNLHLDHNNFNGTLPESYINAGNGRLTQISIEHNQLTGALPGDHEFRNILGKYTILNLQAHIRNEAVAPGLIFVYSILYFA